MTIKKWLLFIVALMLLSGCVETQTTTYSIEDKLPSKIQKHLDQQQVSRLTGIQLFSNTSKKSITYYVIYDSFNEIEGFPIVSESVSNQITIKFFDGEKLGQQTRYIYKITREIPYETILIEKNGLPSSFDVVGSY